MNPSMSSSSVRSPLPGSYNPMPGNFTAPSASASESRRERRYIVNQLAEVCTAGTARPSWLVRIRDISSRGMQLVVDEPMYAGPNVKIHWNGRDILGTVRYNKFEAPTYRIGIELEGPSNSLVIEMLAKQSEDLQKGAFLVEQQEAVLQRYLALLDLASEWPALLPQPVLSPTKYLTLLDLASDAMIVTSKGGAILFWNKAAEQLYGWTREEAVGRQTTQLYEAPAGAEIPAEGEVRHRRKGGSVVRVKSCSIIQQDSSGEPEAVIFINRSLE